MCFHTVTKLFTMCPKFYLANWLENLKGTIANAVPELSWENRTFDGAYLEDFGIDISQYQQQLLRSTTSIGCDKTNFP